MGRTADPQQPLEITPGMKIAIAVVLAIGLMSSIENRTGRNEGQLVGLLSGGRPTIVRMSGEPISFPQFGIMVTPQDGWSHLSIENGAATDELTFVNESLLAIATISRFGYSSWPPTRAAVVESAVEDAAGKDTWLERAVITNRDYKFVNVQWLELDGKPTLGTGRRYGRLVDGPIDLLITVMRHSSDSKSQDPIATLCNGIQPIE